MRRIIEMLHLGQRDLFDAARGKLRLDTEGVSQIEDEIMNRRMTPAEDKKRLLEDRRRVAADFAKVFNERVYEHV